MTSMLSLRDAAELVREALGMRKFIAMICMCEAQYMGRARSFLNKGERLIVIKEDTSFLIHRATELEPVNWQPPPNRISVSLGEDYLALTVKRIRKPEKIMVKVYGFKSFFSDKLSDNGSFHMYLSEKDISENIRKHPELIEDGFRIISTEYREKVGIIDVLGIDARGRRTIVEIKKDKAGKDAVRQVLRYVQETGKGVRTILLSPHITPEAEKMLRKSGIEYKRISMFELSRIITHWQRSESSITSFLKEES
ncbi:MAG: endonuclease NucS [Crenarchaeota archaeon]|nr:endonuclease NucS [Thermoproteota archaeon]MDW8034343.1 endonuclease NucS [Nitrososphaerota archaeon]